MFIKATVLKMEENGIITTGTERIFSDGEAIKHINIIGDSDIESEKILKNIRTKTSIEMYTDEEMEALCKIEDALLESE